MVTVHSREHLPLPLPASCLVPCAAACSKCRESSRGGLSALTGFICLQTPPRPGVGGLACCTPKVLCNSWCCCQSRGLHRTCWGTAGPPAPQAEPLLPPLSPDTRSAYMHLSSRPTDAVQVGQEAVPDQISQHIASKHWRCLEHHSPTDTILQQENQSVCHVVEELRAVLGNTIPGATAGISTPLTSPHTSLPQVLIYLNQF